MKNDVMMTKEIFSSRSADPHLGQALAEPDGRLPAEEALLCRRKEVVQVGEQAVELVRVRIPIGQQRHLYHHPHEGSKLAWCQPIEVHQHEGDGGNEHAVPQHRRRMVHPVVEEDNQQRRQQVVYQRNLLYREQPLVGLHALEYVYNHPFSLYHATARRTPRSRS